MNSELRPFKVWLGFIAAAAAFLLILIVPSEQKIQVEFYYDPANQRYVPKPVADVSEMHPLMALPALCLAAGWTWWFFWLHRRHQQLARLTNSTYPIGPKQAVGFHFIPGYNLYWAFHWTRPFTHLCDLVESGLMKPAPPGAENAGKPQTILAGNLSGVSETVKPGWLPGIFLSLAMLVACGVFIPRNFVLRTFEVVPPLILIYFFWSLLIALGVATYLDRRFVAAFASATPSGPSSKGKSTLGI